MTLQTESPNTKQNNSGIFKIIIFSFLALGLGLGLGFLIGKSTGLFTENNTSGFQLSKDPRGSIFSTASYSSAVKKANGAVVNVFSERQVRGISPMELFWGGVLNEGEELLIPQMNRKQKSLGSGVLISADGYVLTNSHVITGADKISIALSNSSNEKEYEAKLVAMDSKTDLALLKIEAYNLPYVPFADSDAVEIGDVVLAIGNPFGIGQTVTMGIVSATKRENLGLVDYEDFIQTDAAINPGNSGGALIDSKGNLIGINTAIFSKSGGYQGIGFAVPSKLAKKIADQLRTNGKVNRTHLGVSVVNLNEQINPLTSYLLEKGYEGALVIKTQKDGPADRAGINPGILITAVNDKKIKSSEQLFKIVSESPSDGTLEIDAFAVNLSSGKVSEEHFSVKPFGG
ncbi:MAG: trypsin-like peptidase domain-containing protein [Candidatus Caenarcaniphilales bacterium]|nr:trypsin-like peptidase domain-containing protein [Candidatus Caenarcaniphilales bacterium]